VKRTGKQHTNRTIKQAYQKSRSFDRSCRCHGGCPWCERNRLFKLRRSIMDSNEQLRDAEAAGGE
jgi:hypothetical protein